MAIYTLQFEVDHQEYQEILAFEKDSEISIAELIKTYLKSKIQASKPKDEMDYPQIDALIGKYAKYARNTEPVSIEDMNGKMLDVFAKDWQQREAYNMSDEP